MNLQFTDLLGIVSLILAIVALIITIVGFFASLQFYTKGQELQDNATRTLATISETTKTIGEHVTGIMSKAIDALINNQNENNTSYNKLYSAIENAEKNTKQLIDDAQIGEKEKIDNRISALFESIISQVTQIKLKENESPSTDLKIITPKFLNDGSSTLLAFASGVSFDENVQYNIYYDPIDRNHSKPFKYIGLYAHGSICRVGSLNKIVYCDYDEVRDMLISTNNYNIASLSEDEKNRIKGIIKNTDYYDLSKATKFFLVDKFYETNFDSPSFPIRAKEYFWLNEIEGFKEGMTAEEVAKLLVGKTRE